MTNPTPAFLPLLNDDVVVTILKGHLSLSEILLLRLVCKQWKDRIDDYLATHEHALMIHGFEGSDPPKSLLSLQTLAPTMGLDMTAVKRSKTGDRRLLSYKKKTKMIQCNIPRMLPSITELYVMQTCPDRLFSLLRQYPKLKKLIILTPICSDDYRTLKLVKHIQGLQNLETLIILDGSQPVHGFNFQNEFLQRLKRFYIPHLDYKTLSGPLEAESIVLHRQDILSYGIFSLTPEQFPRLKSVTFPALFSPVGAERESFMAVCLEQLYNTNPDIESIAFLEYYIENFKSAHIDYLALNLTPGSRIQHTVFHFGQPVNLFCYDFPIKPMMKILNQFSRLQTIQIYAQQESPIFFERFAQNAGSLKNIKTLVFQLDHQFSLKMFRCHFLPRLPDTNSSKIFRKKLCEIEKKTFGKQLRDFAQTFVMLKL